MNAQRYEELLGRLLDHELSEAEDSELSDALRTDPRLRSDTRRHLILWEHFAQQHAAERSGESFVHAWRTRLQATLDADQFVEQTARRIAVVSEDTGPKPEVRPLIAPVLPAIPAKPVPWWVPHIMLRNWRIPLAAAALLALSVGLSVWFLGPAMGEPTLETVSGTVILDRLGELPATAGIPLQPGDVLRTFPNASAAIAFGDEQTRINLAADTAFKLVSLSRGKRFELRAGKLDASASRQRPFQPMVIRTPNAEARVLGTVFTLTAATNRTRLDVTQGKVRLTDSINPANEPVKVSAGQYAVVAAATELAALPATGRILREYWTNYTGSFKQALTADPSLAARPDAWDHLSRFQSKPLRPGLRFGERVRGYVQPPVTGPYRFTIAAARVECEIHLSRTDKPQDVVQVAWKHPDGGGSRLERVTPIPLQAGRKYYIEIVHESDGGEDQLTVMWQAPGRDPEIIPGEFLSPFPTNEKKGKR